MRNFFKMLLAKVSRLQRDKSGVTAIEYGMIAGLIAVVIIGAVQTIGTEVSETFTAVGTALQEAQGGGGGGAPPAPPQ